MQSLVSTYLALLAASILLDALGFNPPIMLSSVGDELSSVTTLFCVVTTSLGTVAASAEDPPKAVEYRD